MTDENASVREWILDGRYDMGRWAANGLGIYLHDKQLEVISALDKDEATYYFLWWANRAGKTTLVIVAHLHRIFYKLGLPVADPANKREYELWLKEDYRTLHTAPLNELAGRAWSAAQDILTNTSRAQRDEDGKRRPAPLAPFFTAAKERDAAGADRMVVRSLSGGVMDFRSTEGGAGRIEGMAWRFGSWDEWPQQENKDQIRSVLVRLTNRLSDYDGKLLLTGTITEDTEHIAKEWISLAEDPSERDWWGNSAARSVNPSTTSKSLEIAERQFDEEDYQRTVMGVPGGVRGRLLPGYMVDPVFSDRSLPRFQAAPQSEADKTAWTFMHIWDLAIAAADNIGHVWRIPADWRFGFQTLDSQTVYRPIVGVYRKRIPGSRTLTTAEIIHTIEETYLPYGGRIVLDTTDAHGKAIHRELRRAGYPVEAFTFNERDSRRVTRKEAAINHARALLTEGMELIRDGSGQPRHDPDGVPLFARDRPYGVLRLPHEWTMARDQLSVLKVDDDKQRKDEAMVVLMGLDEAYRTRRAKTHRAERTPFRVFTSGRRYK